MLPIDIINNLLSEYYYIIKAKYCEYTEKKGYVTLANGSVEVTFKCQYETIDAMEEDMNRIGRRQY